jgi:hypothetical protein
LQIVHRQYYSDAADHQYATPSSNIYERGTIFFQTRNKGKEEGQLISAAVQTTGFKLAIAPDKIVNPDKIYEELSKIISLNKSKLF